jgi:signal transduction histidine kinase
MRLMRPVLLVAMPAGAGALATLGVGAAVGMSGHEVRHLALLLLPAVALTSGATVAVAPLLARSSLRGRLVAVALVATLVGLANLAVIAALMFVSPDDATQVAVLLVYSTTAGVGAALVMARSSASAVDRLARTAARLAEGDLDARTGQLDAGPELDSLAATLDEMGERLGASMDRERTAEAQRRDLITAVSHDLRTPLSGLLAMIEAIEDGVVEDPATIRRYVGEMRSSVDSLVNLVDDLFELVQLDAGAIAAERRRARLQDVVQSAVAACDAQALKKRLVLETRLDGTDAVLTSPRLTRVVQNLLQNAIRHTPSDGTVRIEAWRAASGVNVVVEDTGEGIDAASVDHVFEPFWRGDESRAGEGSGLGLALAKRIVEALGGSITVDSAPAHGARFAVLLPDG